MSNQKIAKIVLDRIIKDLENGEIPWEKPWTTTMPKNVISKKEYSGINRLILGSANYGNPYWLTWNQAKKLGIRVKEDEAKFPQRIVFWKIIEIKNNRAPLVDQKTVQDVTRVPMLRYYQVYNVEQLERIPDNLPMPKESVTQEERIEEAEKIIANYPETKPTMTVTRSNKAYYSPSNDEIVIPLKTQFKRIEGYYTTFFHEMGHSTGHETRLNRDLKSVFGDHKYSFEELVAELTCAFLAQKIGITAQQENTSAYIQNWLSALRGNPEMLLKASTKAEKAYKYILGIE